jgi:hypothetical protein
MERMMASRAKGQRSSDSSKFMLDLHYVRAQANEAIRNFFEPLSGLLRAALGTSNGRDKAGL